MPGFWRYLTCELDWWPWGDRPLNGGYNGGPGAGVDNWQTETGGVWLTETGDAWLLD